MTTHTKTRRRKRRLEAEDEMRGIFGGTNKYFEGESYEFFFLFPSHLSQRKIFLGSKYILFFCFNFLSSS